MYLRIVFTGPVLYPDGVLRETTVENLIGPFASEKEREDYRQEWIVVLENTSAIITSHDTFPKSGACLMSVATAKRFLAILKNLKNARR